MSTNISRRKVVAGAAWATPVVAASAVVPAFASSTECEWESTPKFSISGTDTGAKTVQKFVVPAKVDKISFVIKGGAGGTQYSIPGGAAAQISGTIAVKEGQTVEIVSAAGGVGYDEDTPAEGGEGYGNGGSSKGDNPIPESIINKAKAAGASNRWMMRTPKFASSGGGSSAIIVDGTVIAVAGGGGGVGYIRAGGTNLNPAYVFPGATNAEWWKSDTYPWNLPFLLSRGGNASGLAGGAGEKGSGAYTAPTTIRSLLLSPVRAVQPAKAVRVASRRICRLMPPRMVKFSSTAPTTRSYIAPLPLAKPVVMALPVTVQMVFPLTLTRLTTTRLLNPRRGPMGASCTIRPRLLLPSSPATSLYTLEAAAQATAVAARALPCPSLRY